MVSAGEALGIRLAERLAEFFGGIPILDGIGSTEVGQTFVSNTVQEWRPGTLGKVLPPYEIRVVAPDGASAEPDVEGDLWVRGPSIAAGYWNRSTNLLTDGDWLNTGDRVSVDGEGWVTYRCRADDIEIVGGLNVDPAEVERLIIEDPNVAEAAVVSVRESTGAWALQAFVVPGSGRFDEQLVTRDIHRRLTTQLSAFKVPHRFAIAEQLPRTSTGKLMRGVLRAQSAAQPIWDLPSDSGPASNVRIAENDATFKERLAVLQAERQRLVIEAVGAEAANILGARAARSLNPDLTFAELGFDSQMTVELRNRMAAVTGLQLRDTVGWDYGSITGLARYLDAELAGSAGPVQPASSATIRRTGGSGGDGLPIPWRDRFAACAVGGRGGRP